LVSPKFINYPYPITKPTSKQDISGSPTTNVQEKQPSKVSILEEMSVSPNQDEIDELIEPEPQISHQPLGAEQQGIQLSIY
jgi:hypothetical protein